MDELELKYTKTQVASYTRIRTDILKDDIEEMGQAIKRNLRCLDHGSDCRQRMKDELENAAYRLRSTELRIALDSGNVDRVIDLQTVITYMSEMASALHSYMSHYTDD